MILAGITIAQLTGNGLFEKAKEAKKRSENAQELENSILNEYSNQIEKSEIKEEGKTADELIEMSDLAGREVTYIKYKDIYGNQQDKWIIVYIRENKDTAKDIVDDMPVDENHIYLLPKYSVAQYDMYMQWGGNVVGNGTYYWLDNPTWVDAIARVDSDGGRSGNGLAY